VSRVYAVYQCISNRPGITGFSGRSGYIHGRHVYSMELIYTATGVAFFQETFTFPLSGQS
jgi:hypothetical protein